MRKRILVIDDDVGLCKLLDKTLLNGGYAVTVAYSGADGLEAYHRDNPDLILLDIAMPGFTGWSVAKTIRKEEETSGQHIPILILSAHARMFELSTEFQAGIDGYLTKPVTPPEILAHVEALLVTGSLGLGR